MLDKLDATFSFHQNALKLRGQRQQILAANIANADTPKYKARDIDFKAEMQKVVGGNSANALTNMKSPSANSAALKMAGTLNTTAKNHMTGTPTTNPFNTGTSEAMYRPMQQGSVDGNTVDMDVERNSFADNAVRYEASILMINGAIKKMLTAITGQ
jgi:flagellar basal-body rod protein FlgB